MYYNMIFVFFVCRHYDMNPKGKARAGRTFGHVMAQMPDGFTKSTAVHAFGPAIDTTAQLRNLHPYVARLVVVCIYMYCVSF